MNVNVRIPKSGKVHPLCLVGEGLNQIKKYNKLGKVPIKPKKMNDIEEK